MAEDHKVSTDWEIKFLPRQLFHGLIYFRDKYYEYKLRGRDHPSLKAQYVNKLNTLYFSVETYFQQYLERERQKKELPDISEYDKLCQTPLPSDEEIRRLEKALLAWLFDEGYFRTLDKKEKEYNSIEEQYENE